MKKILIIPDVHGISDWKLPVKRALKSEDVDIVFLGDYVDSWSLSVWDILDNLKEIVELKRQHSDRITLLFGNHDFAYIFGKTQTTGFEFKMWFNYKEVYENNRDLFQLAWGYQGKEKYTLLTHAGLTNWYYGRLIREVQDKETKMYKIFEGMDYKKLPLHVFLNYFKDEKDLMWKVGYTRRGSSPSGSIMWAGQSELVEDPYPGIDQIVGHTALPGVEIRKVFNDTLYFVDTHREKDKIVLNSFYIELD